MYETTFTNPGLPALIETLKEPATAMETFVVNDGESDAVRLVLRHGEIEIVLDVVVEVSPDGDSYYLDPYLRDQSCSELMSQGLLPGSLRDAKEQGSVLAVELTVAHRDRIFETARRATAD